MDLGRLVHILSRQIKRRIDEAVSKYNVTGVQCSFIGYISKESKKNKVYAKDIENKFSMRRATVAEILSLMEKNSLIKRNATNDDARLKEITLTKKSLDIENEIKKEITRVEKDLKKDLTRDELDKFIEILKKMSKNLS